MMQLKKARKIALLALLLLLSFSLVFTGVLPIASTSSNELSKMWLEVDGLPVEDTVELDPTEVEIKYDDGSAEYCFWWSGAGPEAAVRFTPTVSGQLVRCRFYVCSDPANVKVHVRDSSRNNIITPFTQSVTTTGWIDVDLSAYGISVTSGIDFYIGVEWTTGDAPKLGEDRTAPIDYRSWDWDGASWSQWTLGDYMIRAYVETGVPGAKEWTYMVYQDGDNNLEGCEIETFLMMASIGSTSEVDIVTQMDRTPGEDTRYGDWTDTKRFHVTAGLTPTPTNAIQDLPEMNMGHPSTLTDFVNWAVSNYPANHYCLVLSDHGSGTVQAYGEGVVPPYGEDFVPQGVCFDDTSGGDCLTTTELRTALSGVGTTMDVLFFDACLQGMVGVAYQIADYANIMVGSEDTAWGPGPYDDYLSALVANPLMSPGDFATHIVNTYVNWITTYSLKGTMSAVNLAGVCLTPLNGPHLITSISNLAQELTNKMSTYYSEIGSARSNAEGYEGPYGGMSGYYIDLYHFAQLIYDGITDSAIRSYATDVMVDIANVVIAYGQYLNPHSRGLSIFFPETEEKYTTYNFDTTFKATMFAADTQWDEFLEAYYAGAPPVVSVYFADCYLDNYVDNDWDGYAETVNANWDADVDDSYYDVWVFVWGIDSAANDFILNDYGPYTIYDYETDYYSLPFTVPYADTWDIVIAIYDAVTLGSPLDSCWYYDILMEPPDVYTFADLKDLFVPVLSPTRSFDSLIVYGESLAHTLWGSRTIDVVGGTSIAMAFTNWADTVSCNNQLDIDVYDEATEEFLLAFRNVPLIAIGGPNVNWAFWHYNHYIPHNPEPTSQLLAYFRWWDGEWPTTGHPEVRTITGNSYAEEWVTGTEIYSYAVVELYFDPVYGRIVLLVAGICGPATRAACEWLAGNMLGDSILTDPTLSGCAAFVLRVRMVHATGEVTEVTVIECIPD